MLAQNVGSLIGKRIWVGIPFGGGMPEVQYINARTIIVNDKHLHVINLARCIKDDTLREILYARLMGEPFHPESLKQAQKWCLENPSFPIPSVVAAENYFIAVWMNRSGLAGTRTEFSGNLSVRWTGEGGDSNTRYRSAIESLEAWSRVFVRCNFTTLDVFDFLAEVLDIGSNALYLDPPFPDVGGSYLHTFSEDDHRALASWLNRYRNIRIVCRFYDHPLIRELYSDWTWHHQTERDQANQAKDAVLLVRN